MASKNADEDAASQRPALAPAETQTTPAALRPKGSGAVEQRVVAALRGGDRSTAFVKACLLMKQAFEHPDVNQQLDLGRQALAFSPDLADLYVALTALVRARREALTHYLRGPAEPQTTFGAPAAPAAGLRPAGAVTPDWSQTLGPVTPRSFGHNTVWVRGGLGLWDEATETFHPEVVDLVRALRPGVLRFPGGTRAMLYHFAGAIGPRQSRTPQCDPYTGEFDPTGYGPDEFLQLATQLGAEVTLVSPWVDGTPEEAAALVAYVNADPASAVPLGRDDNGTDWGTAGDWARRRAENGHPAPYGVPFLEIGNEQYLSGCTPPPTSCGRPGRFCQNQRRVQGQTIPTTARDHAQQVARTGRLVRAVDPSIRIGASAFSPTILIGADELGGLDVATALAANDRATGDPWNIRLVEEAGADFDFFILHPYNLVTVPFFPPQDPLILAENLRQAVHQLRALDATKQIAVTEFGYLFFAASLLGALLAAQVVRVALEEQLLMTLRHLLIEDRTLLFNLQEPFANSAAIQPDPMTSGATYRTTPGYWAIKLLAESLSGSVVPVRTAVPGLVALTTSDPAAGRAAVVLIRNQPAGITWDVSVGLPPGTWSGTVATLSGPVLFTPLTEIGGDRSRVGPASGTVTVGVPAHALVVLALSRS
jgi:hypothetical protein